MAASDYSTVRNTVSRKKTDELLRIWVEHDTGIWTATALGAVADILTERGIELPAYGGESSLQIIEEKSQAVEVEPMELARRGHGGTFFLRLARFYLIAWGISFLFAIWPRLAAIEEYGFPFAVKLAAESAGAAMGGFAVVFLSAFVIGSMRRHKSGCWPDWHFTFGPVVAWLCWNLVIALGIGQIRVPNTSPVRATGFEEVEAKAVGGDAEAQDNLGAVYATGMGVAKDEAKAVEWFRQAANKGYAPAQGHLGTAYANGTGVSNDDAEAVKWFRKAADQGYAKAQNSLGFFYEKGRGVSKDGVEAVKWYRMAAEQGDPPAQCNLGIAYALGFGVPKDAVVADKWFNLSAGAGMADAKRLRPHVEAEMTPEQIAEAQRRSREFKPRYNPSASIGIK